ncbi:lasso peptide isopeptide bond-forming cyclase [Saccharothrix violaceirubra]|uniref:Asparagine synthase (Glutamine-hydrolyzing) n=1 Tax=Saccharothrix violaceirubra TaxID=413306 RepID=A0A7W7T522_9PSEU|nr:albusnodin/ikarugamycin family macrolactam cyclase [Saccharothrix violaceirubra]MBB4966147.1 asparagine synthase (glutamine-hydrolyzing) [Saccharothrix violaceirubra]
MRWIAGRHGPGTGWVPVGDKVEGCGGLWSAEWPPARVRTVGDGNRRMAVFGDCAARAVCLERGLRAAVAGDLAAVTRWPGSYLVVLRDADRTVVVGDLPGMFPVHWTTQAATTWWSTSALLLVADRGVPPVEAVDPPVLAAQLAFGQPDLPGTRSVLRGVRRVPTGHALMIDEHGPVPVRHEPIDPAPSDRSRAAPALSGALRAAVESRLDGRPVSADLAGVDSTTLAVLAAERGPVLAVTFADDRLRDDDLAHARRTAAVVAALDHRVARDPAAVYYAGLGDPAGLPLTDAPNAYTATLAVKDAVFDTVTAAHGDGGVHFTGSAGDGVLGAGPDHLADLLRARRYGPFAAGLLGHARLRAESPWTLLARVRPAATMAADSWRATARTLHRPATRWEPDSRRPWAWSPPGTVADWLPPPARHDLADLLDTAADQAASATWVPDRLEHWTTRQRLAQLAVDVTGRQETARTRHGVEVAAPYPDSEVVRVCAAVPGRLRGNPHRYKPLLQAAFTGVVPDHVLHRATKGGFDAIAYRGLRDHGPTLLALLGGDSRLAALGLLDPVPATAMLDRACTGRAAAMGALHQVIAAELWLRRLDHAPGRPQWTEQTPEVACAATA